MEAKETEKTSDPSPETMAKVKKEVLGLFRSGMWNSGMLAFMFCIPTYISFASGSYFGVTVGVLAIFLSLRDAKLFHTYYKLNKDN